MRRLTTIITTSETIKAGRSTYILNKPPSGLTRNVHMNTNAPPANIPEIAPARVVLFQKREHSITAPNAPPNPAHANDTIWNTLELGFLARKILTSETHTTVTLARIMFCFSVILIPKKSLIRLIISIS